MPPASKAVLRAVPDPDGTFVTEPTRRANGKMPRWVQNDLMRELALGERPRSELAREYNVTPGYITRFADRYARPIGKLRANMENEFAHLWIAEKVNRLLLLQRHVAQLDRIENPTAEERRTLAGMLKQAAEELGQLPIRQAVVSARVTHVVEGFTTSELEGMLS